MRVIGAFILTIALTTGAARASSFIVIDEAAPASTPSIVQLGQPAPAKMAKGQAPSSWIDRSLGQLQQAFAAMKQPDMRRFPSLEAIPSGEAISADNMATPSIIAMGEPAPGIGY
ncbi:MAG TPA: hypothetical protein VGM46_10090, partial [Mesorhizobium sp.]